MRKVLIYYSTEDTEFKNPKKKSWEIRGNRNSTGLHPNKDDERDAILFTKKPGIYVTASYYEEKQTE